MFQTIRIENFRRFGHFELHGLGRVNLLVGLNNSGKTSVLEAVHLLATHLDVVAFIDSMMRRGERVFGIENGREELDICRLFHNHTLEPGKFIEIEGKNDNSYERIELKYSEDESVPMLVFGRPDGPAWSIEISTSRGISTKDLARASQSFRKASEERRRGRFGHWSPFSVEQVIGLFDKVVLTPDETILLDALRIIEPSIERIAAVTTEYNVLGSSPRGGLFVRRKDSDQRIPIGSLGDGIWHMLGLTLALIRARGGVLLIDEIDTGFHYSVMRSMWRLVCQTAETLDVQVFATTHNSDCWTSLAAVAREHGDAPPKVSIQRVEPDKPQAVAFSNEEMVIAAERGIEVR